MCSVHGAATGLDSSLKKRPGRLTAVQPARLRKRRQSGTSHDRSWEKTGVVALRLVHSTLFSSLVLGGVELVEWDSISLGSNAVGFGSACFVVP
jgi:hypothetical protein